MENSTFPLVVTRNFMHYTALSSTNALGDHFSYAMPRGSYALSIFRVNLIISKWLKSLNFQFTLGHCISPIRAMARHGCHKGECIFRTHTDVATTSHTFTATMSPSSSSSFSVGAGRPTPALLLYAVRKFPSHR